MHQKRLLITSRVTNHITFCTRLVSPKNSRPCLAAARSRSLTTGLFCFEGRPLLLETGVGRTKGGVGMERQVCMRMRSSLEAICQHLHPKNPTHAKMSWSRGRWAVCYFCCRHTSVSPKFHTNRKQSKPDRRRCHFSMISRKLT